MKEGRIMESTLTFTANYYELLGVSENASNHEIKKAYYAKIRQFPNETHPEEFQLLTKAYKTLTNTELRKQYDRSIRDDGAFSELFNNAIILMENGQYQKALSSLKKMLISYPNDSEIQKHLAICYFHLDQKPEAKKILLQLEKSYPNDETILNLLGQIFLASSSYNQAKKYYKKLITINPDEMDYVIYLAKAHAHLSEYELAQKAIENKLKRNHPSVYDLPLFVELYFITMAANDESYHQEVINRIKELPKTSDEKHTLLKMLMDLCESLGHKHFAFKELIHLIKDINANENKEIDAWLRNAESHIKNDFIYYGDPEPGHYPAGTYSQDSRQVGGQGSIFTAIIIGIIISIIFTPVVGTIAGILWYFRARAILRIVGILVIISIIIVILSNL